MSFRVFATVGIAALMWTAPAAAQQRGTLELGAFGSFASFDNDLTLKTAFGGGGRAGMFLTPSWSIEFEKGEMRAKRTNGLKDVNVGILSSRLVAVPMRSGGLSFLAGVGAGVSTETNFLHSYGLDALVGVKIAMGDNAALRLDGVWDWLANEEGIPPKAWRQYKTVRLGISLYRNPFREVRTVSVQTPAPPAQIIVREDTSSRIALRNLRDSLNAVPVCVAARVSSDQVIPILKDTPDVMNARLGFACGSAELDESARALLDAKIVVFRATPAMTVVVQGYTDGSDAYNMSLGTRRAQAAKDYIGARGIAANRVTVQSGGEPPRGRTNFLFVITPDVLRRP